MSITFQIFNFRIIESNVNINIYVRYFVNIIYERTKFGYKFSYN